MSTTLWQRHVFTKDAKSVRGVSITLEVVARQSVEVVVLKRYSIGTYKDACYNAQQYMHEISRVFDDVIVSSKVEEIVV